jgi:NosR/NirI family nitrous oxide reductase transcriptional regulator
LGTVLEHPPVLQTGPGTPEEFSGYFIISRAQGWGGPLQLAVQSDSQGTIRRIWVLDHNETLPFYYRLGKKGFFQQFESKHISDPLLPGEDIDSVTQATVSSEAFSKAVREGSHYLGREIFHLRIEETRKTAWSFGWEEVFLLALWAAAAFTSRMRRPVLRYLVMGASFVFLGFYLNSSLSIAHFSALLLGYVPSPVLQPFWWLLVAGALLTPFIFRRNLYCQVLCPFGSLQEANSKISGINLTLSKTLLRAARSLPYILTWLALILVFVRSNPALGAYEPFPTLFGLEGIEIQWLILPAVIFGSFFFTRFFCRFFCPVGAILGLVVKARCRLDRSQSREDQGCHE